MKKIITLLLTVCVCVTIGVGKDFGKCNQNDTTSLETYRVEDDFPID